MSAPLHALHVLLMNHSLMNGIQMLTFLDHVQPLFICPIQHHSHSFSPTSIEDVVPSLDMLLVTAQACQPDQACSDCVWIAGPCVVNVYINYEKKFAFVEFRTGELFARSCSLAGLALSHHLRRHCSCCAVGPQVSWEA